MALTIDSPEEVMTVAPGNARPSSSAVRRAPITMARNASDPHRVHRSAVSARPHQRHTAELPVPVSDSGPVQCLHRAMLRHRLQASDGTYPRRGTCTNTGRCCSSAARAARSATDGTRAVRAAGSRASA